MEAQVEVIAPAETWQSLETSVAAGVNAVYVSRNALTTEKYCHEFGIDKEGLRAMVEYLHSHSVKLYIVMNSLLSDEEVRVLPDYLSELEQIGVDAIIIRDLTMLDILQDREYRFSIYAFLPLNTRNLESVSYLKDRGVTRIFVSKELSLAQIKSYSEQTEMEIGYIACGESCFAQNDQILHNGVLYGQSGDEKVQSEKLISQHTYVFNNFVEMSESGVRSFIIEGLGQTESIPSLIERYRTVIKSFYTNTMDCKSETLCAEDTHPQKMEEENTLSVTSGFGDLSGCQIYNHYPESVISTETTSKLKEELGKGLDSTSKKELAKLTVAVPTFDHFTAALQAGAERLLVGGDIYYPYQPWTFEELAFAIRLGYQYGAEVIYRTPTIISEEEMNDLKMLFEVFSEYHLRVMTGNPGVIEALYGADLSFTLYGDLGFNAFNSRLFNYLKRQGFDSAIISLHAGVEQIKEIGRNSIIEVEMLAQGPLCAMITDNCLFFSDKSVEGEETEKLYLVDETGNHLRVEFDQYKRNHIFRQNHLALLPVLGELVLNGVTNFRIEGLFYTPEELVEIYKIYHKVIRYDYDQEIIDQGLLDLQNICKAPLTFGVLDNQAMIS